jgi:hypothetical protein
MTFPSMREGDCDPSGHGRWWRSAVACKAVERQRRRRRGSELVALASSGAATTLLMLRVTDG